MAHPTAYPVHSIKYACHTLPAQLDDARARVLLIKNARESRAQQHTDTKKARYKNTVLHL